MSDNASTSVTKSKYGWKVTFATLMLYCDSVIISILSPVLAFIAATDYPTLDFATVSYIATITSVAVLPTALAANKLTAKFGFRKVAVTGLLLVAIFGSLPYFWNDFTFVLIGRAIVGLGVGLCMPLGNAIAILLFKGEGTRTTRVQGWGNSLTSAFGIFYQFVSTAVAVVDPNLCFLIHGVVVIPMFIILAWLPEPPKYAEAGVNKGEKKARKHLPAMVYILCILFALTIMFFYPAMLSVSQIIMTENLGGPSVIVIASVMYVIGGVVSGLIFSTAYNKLGNKFFLVYLPIIVAAIAIYAFGHSAIMLGIGLFLGGFYSYSMQPGIVKWLTERVGASKAVATSGIFMVFLNGIAFFSSFYMQGVNGVFNTVDPRMTMVVSVVAIAVIAVIFLIYSRAKQNVVYAGEEEIVEE